MSAKMLHYVCDACGNRWRAYRAITCPACKAKRVWEFPNADAAMIHASHVKQANKRRAVKS